MKWSLLMIVVLFSACSQFKKKEPVVLEDVTLSPLALMNCQTYQKQVLEFPISAAKDKSVQFTRDIRIARKVLAQVDMEKGLYLQKANMVQNVLRQCDEESLKKFDEDFKSISSCNLMFSELSFFQGLAIGIKKYPWPTDLKLEGKKVALDYVKYFSVGHFPLLNRLVALSVLDELSINEVVNRDLHEEIKVLMQDSQSYVQGLKMKLSKDPKLTCDSLQIIRDELKYSDQLAVKMKDLINRI